MVNVLFFKRSGKEFHAADGCLQTNTENAGGVAQRNLANITAQIADVK